MRKLLLLCLISCCLFSCKKDLLTVSFDLSQQTSFTVPVSGPVGLINLPLIPITTNWSSTFSANKSDVNHLKSLTAKSITLHVTNPKGKTLRFLKSINIYISAQGQNESELAFKNPVPDSVGTSMALDLPSLELAPYVKQNQFNIRVSFEQRESLFQPVDIEADMVFGAVAYLLN